MKRFILFVLMMMFFAGSAWAGTELMLDDVSDKMLDGAVGETVTGEVGGEVAALVLGEVQSDVQPLPYPIAILGQITLGMQTPSMSVVLTATPRSFFTQVTVTFEVNVAHAKDRSIALYEWDLDGDGDFDESATASPWGHAFEKAGIHLVQVQVTDDLGNEALSEPLRIEILNRSPIAQFDVNPDVATEGDAVQFESSAYDLDGEIVSWVYHFGDGSTSDESASTHVYTAMGLYEVTLTATDDDGSYAVATADVNVRNVAPEAMFSVQQSVLRVGEPLLVTDQSIDPSAHGDIVHVAWDFGDGTFQAGSPSSDATYSHVYTEAGIFRVTLYVIDNDGGLDHSQSTIRVL